MGDERRTKKELLAELQQLRKRNAELEVLTSTKSVLEEQNYYEIFNNCNDAIIVKLA